MSLFIGTPTNSILLKEYLNMNKIDITEANKLIYVLYFSNPLFLYNMLSLMFDISTTIKMIIFHYLSNFLILFVIRNKSASHNNKHDKVNSIPFNILITNSCKKAIETLITILGIVAFYNLIISYFPTIYNGLFEITSGLNYLAINQINNKEIICIIFVNFGGFSIYNQIKSILQDTSIDFHNYFKGRFLQIIICLFIQLL